MMRSNGQSIEKPGRSQFWICSFYLCTEEHKYSQAALDIKYEKGQLVSGAGNIHVKLPNVRHSGNYAYLGYQYYPEQVLWIVYSSSHPPRLLVGGQPSRLDNHPGVKKSFYHYC